MDILIQITLFLVIILSILFFFKGKLTAWASSVPGLVFGTCLILTLSALFWAAPFRSLADWSLQKAGIYQAIQSTDQTLHSYKPSTIYQEKKETAQQATEGLFQSVKDRLWKSDSESESNSNSPETETEATEQPTPGFLEENLYPQLVGFFTSILRFLAVILGLVGLGLATYLGYASQSLRQAQKLSRRCSKLEKEVAELKKKIILE